MTKRSGILAVAAVVLCAMAVPARGQIYIGVRGGLSNQDVERQGSLGDIKFDKDSAFLYGGQVGIRLSALAIEGQIYRADHDLLSGDTGAPANGVELDYYYLGVNGKLGLPLPVIYPYVTAGYGKYTADLAGFGKDADGAFNVGAGAELSIGKVGLFGELRYKKFSFELDNQDWDFKGVELHFGLNVNF